MEEVRRISEVDPGRIYRRLEFALDKHAVNLPLSNMALILFT